MNLKASEYKVDLGKFSYSDLKGLNEEELIGLIDALRQTIVEIVACNGGHLGASLGAVELTVALHYVLDFPVDKLIWDVGHQCYAHKLLTSRYNQMVRLRKSSGASGFPSRKESQFDSFGTGHSSTSISAALGMAIASVWDKQGVVSVAVIGDGAITGGMAFEALNHAGTTKANLIIVLNDNGMSIDDNVGSLNEGDYEVFFRALNIQYHGPVDGHDFPSLVQSLKYLKDSGGVRVLHCKTVKGKGYEPAEVGNTTYWHAPGKFEPKTGDITVSDSPNKRSKFQDVFGLTLVELAALDDRVVGVTPAMATGSSLNFLKDEFPDRFFDVGIAEQHAVTFSAGLATMGKMVFCNLYSTFSQRAYDQIIHDVAIQKLPVIFCLDRAGFVGADGATHQGLFDMAFLRPIPNLIIAAPLNEKDLRNLLFSALDYHHPMVIRYPRGYGHLDNWREEFESVPLGKSNLLRAGEDFAILSVGHIGVAVERVIESLGNRLSIEHVNVRFVKPMHKTRIENIANQFEGIMCIEEGCVAGGFGSSVLEYLAEIDYSGRVKILGVQDEFISHGTPEEQLEWCGLDDASIMGSILEFAGR